MSQWRAELCCLPEADVYIVSGVLLHCSCNTSADYHVVFLWSWQFGWYVLNKLVLLGAADGLRYKCPERFRITYKYRVVYSDKTVLKLRINPLKICVDDFLDLISLGSSSGPFSLVLLHFTFVSLRMDRCLLQQLILQPKLSYVGLVRK